MAQILGNAASLSRNPDWEALIQDAKDRGCYVDASNPEALFPAHIFNQVRALLVSEQGGPTGQGPLEAPGMPAHHPSRKRQKALSPKGKGAVQAGGESAGVSGQQGGGGEGVPEQSGRVESERGASFSGRTEAEMGGLLAHANGAVGMPPSPVAGEAEARRSLPSRDPRRAALGRPVSKPSNLGLPNPSPSTALPKSSSQSELPSPTLRFRPPSPTPGELGSAMVGASKEGQTGNALGSRSIAAPEGAETVDAARMRLAALGVDLRQLDSVRWDAVEKGLHVHTARLRGAEAAAAQPSVIREASADVARQDPLTSRGGTPQSSVHAGADVLGRSRPQAGGRRPQIATVIGKPSGVEGQPPAPPMFRSVQPGAFGGQPFAPGFPNGQRQLPWLASSAGGPPGFPASQSAGDSLLQLSNTRLGKQVAEIGAGPPPNGLALPRLGRGPMGTPLGGGGVREPSANGGPPPTAQVTQLGQQQGSAGLGRAKPSKKQKKGWKQHVDRDQGGGVGPLDPPGMRGRSQAASDPAAHLWNARNLIGSSGGEGISEARFTGEEERPRKVLTKLGVEASPLDVNASKRQRAFDLNIVPEDADVDMDKGPPGFTSEQEPG